VIDVTVAVFGPSFDYGSGIWTGPAFEDQGPEVPYADRLKLELSVDESDTLASVIDRTGDHFGVTFTPAPAGTRLSEIIGGVVFYRPEDENGLERPQPWPTSIRLLDGSGAPSWAVPWRVARYDELLSAAEHGVLDGDPLRPYFWPAFPQGDVLGVLLDPTLWRLLRNYQFIVDHIAGGAIAGAAGWVVKDALDRLKRSHKARHEEPNEWGAEPPIPRWSERLARPDDFLPLLTKEPSTTGEAAAILGCPEGEAEAVLWGLGFALNEADGRWLLGTDEPAALIANDLETARSTGAMPPDLETEALQAQLRSETPGDESDADEDA
jgi:hypothetical protein